MAHGAWLCLGLLAAGAMRAGAAPGDDAQAVARARQDLRAGLLAPQDTASTDAQLRAVIDSQEFTSLTPAEQHAALSAAAQVGLRLKQPARAHELAVRATALPQQGIDDWNTRLRAAVQLEDARDAVLCLTTLGERWGSAGVKPASWAVYPVARASQKAGLGAPRTQLLSLLFDLRWTASDGSEPSGLWRELSLSLLEEGDQTKAQEVGAHVTDPYDLIAMRADRRYDLIRKSRLIERDVLKAAERELEARRTAAASAPRSLEPIVRVMRSLQNLGRYPEAIDAADQALQRLEASGAAAPYDDVARQLPWLLNARAGTLGDMGRFDEDIAVRRRACELAREGDVSVCINLAEALVERGRPAEAVAALPASDTLSSYGKMVIEMIRAGAASESGDAAALEAALAYLREHEADGPALLEHALLMSGRADEAAALLLARLGDPAWRTDALTALQDYRLPAEPERAAQWRSAFHALRERAEIRRSIALTGRIERYPLSTHGY